MKHQLPDLRGLIYFVIIGCLLAIACQLSAPESIVSNTQEVAQPRLTVTQSTDPLNNSGNASGETLQANPTPDHYSNEIVDCSYDEFDRISVSAFSADGQHFVCAVGQVMMMYQVSPLDKVWQIKLEREIESITYSPDGVFLGVASRKGFFIDTLDLYNAHNGKYIRTFNNPDESWYTSIAFSPDSRLIAVNGRQNGGGSFIIDRESGEILCDYAGTGQMAFSADGNILMSGTGLEFYDPKSCTPVATNINPGSYKKIETQFDFFNTADFFVVAASGDWIFGTSDGTYLVRNGQTTPVSLDVSIHYSTPRAISSDGKWFAAAYGYTIKVLALDTGESHEFTDPTMGDFLDIAFTPQGHLVGIYGKGGQVRFWDFDFN